MWTQIVPKTKEIDVDILGFWKTQEPNLSLLSRLAKRVLAIPVSSTSSELVISESGRVVAASQTLQNSDKAEKLIWIQQNHSQLAPLVDRWNLDNNDSDGDDDHSSSN